ncbi:quorum-quenching protein AidA [Microdochium nivale]|nr:quorum-quenching protein AidA [Microdochium nivale]
MFTFMLTLPDDDAEKIIYWGTSTSSGTTIYAATLNKNIAGVIIQVPFVSGEWQSKASGESPNGLIIERAHAIATSKPTMIPIVPESWESVLNKTSQAVLNKPEVLSFLDELDWRGRVVEKAMTVQSMANIAMFEPLAYIHRILPTPLLKVVSSNDVTAATHMQLGAFERAREPKKLHLSSGES